MAIAREGGEPIDLTFFVCNSDTDLYAAVEVDHDLGVLPSEFFLFGLQLTTCDPSPTSCPFQLDDNSAVRWVNGLIEQFDEWRRSEPTAFESFLDVSHGGNDEIVRALSTGDGFTRVEMSKPLTTGDQFDHDLASLGQVIASMTLQFNFQGDPSHYFAGTGAFIYDVR
ncbi:MAG: hypothetical protein R3195_10220 [Gemmatimonadota bacterium]|nr:hypothetical protein [Gemmatimonadota bacterium]